MKNGGISPEISFVDWGGFEMGTAGVVLWWQVSGRAQGLWLPAPCFPIPDMIAWKDTLCVHGSLPQSTLTFGPLSFPAEVSLWHK